jgi:hypothetical protein
MARFENRGGAYFKVWEAGGKAKELKLTKDREIAAARKALGEGDEKPDEKPAPAKAPAAKKADPPEEGSAVGIIIAVVGTALVGAALYALHRVRGGSRNA